LSPRLCCEFLLPWSKLNLPTMANRSNPSEKRAQAQQAKEFLISQIVEEAHKENASLSEIERKMLYFTETEETLPEICQINDQFERDYDSSAYEKKIAGLLRNAYNRYCKESPEGKNRWRRAIADLRGEDHYLLVMLNQSRQAGVDSWAPFLWGIGISILIALVLVVEAILDQKGFVPRWLFGWISDDRQTRTIQFYLILFGLLGLWVVIKLATLGAVRDMTKAAYDGIVSNLSSLLPRLRSRR